MLSLNSVFRVFYDDMLAHTLSSGPTVMISMQSKGFKERGSFGNCFGRDVDSRLITLT